MSATAINELAETTVEMGEPVDDNKNKETQEAKPEEKTKKKFFKREKKDKPEKPVKEKPKKREVAEQPKENGERVNFLKKCVPSDKKTYSYVIAIVGLFLSLHAVNFLYMTFDTYSRVKQNQDLIIVGSYTLLAAACAFHFQHGWMTGERKNIFFWLLIKLIEAIFYIVALVRYNRYNSYSTYNAPTGENATISIFLVIHVILYIVAIRFCTYKCTHAQPVTTETTVSRNESEIKFDI